MKQRNRNITSKLLLINFFSMKKKHHSLFFSCCKIFKLNLFFFFFLYNYEKGTSHYISFLVIELESRGGCLVLTQSLDRGGDTFAFAANVRFCPM